MHGRLGVGGLLVQKAAGGIGLPGHRIEALCIPLLHHPKTTKFPLLAIKKTVVVGMAAHETIAADVVDRFHPLHHMHWKREPRDPGVAVELVLQVEAQGGAVLHPRFGTQVVDAGDEQVGLALRHQRHVTHLPTAVAR